MPMHDRRCRQTLILAAVATCTAGVAAQTECGPGQWVLRSNSGPPARYGHAMAYDSKRGVTVLFGGAGNGPGLLGDTWEWDGNVWVERMVPGPPARVGHGMAFDSARGVCVMFGGAGRLDTWEWDGAAWAQRATTGIANGRTGCAMAYDVARGRTVLFGGSWFQSLPGGGINNQTGDTFEWNGASWAFAGVGPYQLSGTALAYDAAEQRTIAFGGRHINIKTVSVYNWTGRWSPGWTSEPSFALAPFNRYGAAMAYNSATHAVVMFGGFTCNDIWGTWNPTGAAETWEHVGTNWVRRATGGPVRQNAAMAYDSARNRVVMFGGMPIGGMTGLGDTWEWESPSACYPDCNADGAVNLSDFGCFQTRFALGCNYSDCNGDGARNLADFGCFQTKFALGCP
ncbi:MAG: hypothetical protein IT437_00235 [Phycisphaerales bacterium]|nr:hypothetical protein [Phycisphaerales bacterium]